MESLCVQTSRDLPKELCPSRTVRQNLSDALIVRGRCLVWKASVVAPRVSQFSASGVSKRPRRRTVVGKTPRITFKGRKYNVRQLLYAWATARFDDGRVWPVCGNPGCFKPAHQTCKRLEHREELRMRRELPWDAIGEDD